MVGQRVIATVVRVEPYGVWFEHEGSQILVLVTDLPFDAPIEPPKIFSVGEQREVLLTDFIAPEGRYKGLLATD